MWRQMGSPITPTPMKPIISSPSLSKSIPMLETAIPARLDRLPWSAWHWRVVLALGVSWLLDGLEVTVVGSLGPALQRPDTLGLTAGQIGWAASAYIGRAVPRAPALADPPRPCRGSRAHRRRYRASGRRHPAAGIREACDARDARAYLERDRAADVHALPPQGSPGTLAHGLPGAFLQRDLLHL